MITIVNVEENSYEAIGSRVGLSRKSHMFDSAKEQEVAKYFFFPYERKRRVNQSLLYFVKLKLFDHFIISLALKISL